MEFNFLITLKWYGFILITVLFAGFFLLEGFDYGTGILLPFIGKTDVDVDNDQCLRSCVGW